MLYEEYIKTNVAAFKSKVIEVAQALKVDPDWLMIVFYAESRMNEKARNPINDASGLIGFTKTTAKWLGTTVEALRAMSNVQQLDYVLKYFKGLGATGKMNSVYDLYLVTFFPIALGKPDSWVMQTSDMSAYYIAKQNRIVDINKDGKITVGEFKTYVSAYLKKKTLL